MSGRAILTMPAWLLCALVAAAFGAQPAAAASLTFTPCRGQSSFGCATMPVPLAREGSVPGSISLSVMRRLAGGAPSTSAVVGLAGGPGQPALPLREFIAEAIAPALHTRDLLLFDQRGTGSSNPLGCRAVEHFSGGSVSRLFEQCALEIGPARAAFTTEESVRDIEALRVAGGYQKLVLYGTSYGTKVALEYAQQYPERVEALVLDSVVPVDGPEPFAIPSFRALPGVMQELCARRACAAITANPVTDLAALNARLRSHALGGSVFDGHGRRHAAALDEAGLLRTIEAGDVNPALRALLPAAVRSALNGDPDPLLRLHVLSEGLIPTLPRERQVESAESVDEALFATTTCEETRFPWSRNATAATRLAEARGFLEAQPGSYFYPFDAATAYSASLLEACAAWPDASAPPPAEGGLPDVPTLILSGAQDLRTPTSNARQVAAEIPGAELEVVPFTGHSVIGSDLSECASAAVESFFAGHTPAPCASAPNPFSPTPLDPTHLNRLRAPHGLSGRPGRTLVAALEAIVDLSREVVGATLQADAALPTGSSFGGLRGGYAQLSAGGVVLHDFSFVTGVSLSGRLAVRNGSVVPAVLRVSGPQASGGSLRLSDDLRRASGTLGGHSFHLNVSSVKLSSLAADGWPDLARIRGGRWRTR
ncbi:MAG TPA: alpha/beta fold hydrolase [Solirubrobacteraceae bacterium]|nr:alpha/beta fold hydrolase [Solirubrobacteraceae bacterium]